jgi:hypothetical protein
MSTGDLSDHDRNGDRRARYGAVLKRYQRERSERNNVPPV